MDAQPEPTTPSDAKKSFNWWAFMLWAFVILAFYVLSFGPVVKLLGSKRASPSVEDALKTIYYPVWLAYTDTPLHKPLGIYMHLWAPKVIDKNGDLLL